MIMVGGLGLSYSRFHAETALSLYGLHCKEHIVRRFRILALIIAAFITVPASGQAVKPENALKKYVTRPDKSFKWVHRRTVKKGNSRVSELILTSQTWKKIVWKHQLFVILPAKVEPTKHALLFVTGGSWKKELETGPAQPLRRDAQIFIQLADRLQTPVAVLLHVPQQPIFDGKKEDQIISLTFERYMLTGDSEWPLLLPMAKSAVRAMDAVQAYAKKEWKRDIQTFTITGASKRGWTTWLTGAVDKRATAIAPIVIDMLNMKEHLPYQVKVWGKPSYKIGDYTKRGLHLVLNTKPGKALQRIVDPYHYRKQLTQPKLLIIGTNDHYWPLDSLNLYWKDLVGPKYILYVPNNRHGIRDLTRLVGSLNALHRAAAFGHSLPKLNWNFAKSGRDMKLTMNSNVVPTKMRLWTVKSDTRDFRYSTWTSQEINRPSKSVASTITRPSSGNIAAFGEYEFGTGSKRYFLSTNVRVFAGE